MKLFFFNVFYCIMNKNGDGSMKKIGTIMLAILIIFGLSGCKKYTTYTEISYTQLKEKMEAKDTFVLVVGAAHCSACKEYKTTMEEIIHDKQIEIFYIDMDNLTEEEDAKLYSEFVVTSTPTTIFFKDGEQTRTYDRITGAADYQKVEKALIKQGFLEEK